MGKAHRHPEPIACVTITRFVPPFLSLKPKRLRTSLILCCMAATSLNMQLCGGSRVPPRVVATILAHLDAPLGRAVKWQVEEKLRCHTPPARWLWCGFRPLERPCCFQLRHIGCVIAQKFPRAFVVLRLQAFGHPVIIFNDRPRLLHVERAEPRRIIEVVIVRISVVAKNPVLDAEPEATPDVMPTVARLPDMHHLVYEHADCPVVGLRAVVQAPYVR